MLNKQHLYDPLATSPDPLFSPPSPEPSNSAAAAQIKMRGSQTEGRRKWTESKVDVFLTDVKFSLYTYALYTYDIYICLSCGRLNEPYYVFLSSVKVDFRLKI